MMTDAIRQADDPDEAIEAIMIEMSGTSEDGDAG
jgi:hypothetical protein